MTMNPAELKGALEVIIYAADEPATLDQIANAVADIGSDDFHADGRQTVMRPHQVDAGRQIGPRIGQRSVQIKNQKLLFHKAGDLTASTNGFH